MEIKTKFNIGDKVWTTNADDEPVEFIIGNIEIRRHRWLRPTLIFYTDDEETITGMEEDTFSTKEELLKSLSDETKS